MCNVAVKGCAKGKGYRPNENLSERTSDLCDGGNAVRSQLPVFGAICACNEGSTHVTETEQLGLAREGDDWLC